MTAIQIAALGVVAIVLGFVIGFFSYLLVRYFEKKRAIKKIEEQNLKFKNCEVDNFKEVIKENEQNKSTEIEEQDRRTPKGNGRRTGFGRAYN